MFIGKESKTAELAARIEADIRTGVLAPGSRLSSQRELCSQLGVSNIVVINALRILEERGLVVSQPRRGVLVSPDFRGSESRLVGVVTSYRHGDIEDYFEPLFTVADDKRVVPMVCVARYDADWRRSIADMMARSPDAVVVDVEGRHFPLEELRRLFGAMPICHINRWEWSPERPERAVLVDKATAWKEGLRVLTLRGHGRILLVLHHRHPPDYLLAIMAETQNDINRHPSDLLLKNVFGEEINDEPECVRRLVADFAPTAVLGWSDHLLLKLEIICPETAFLDRIGFLDTTHSRRQGREFSSFRVDFGELWRLALDSFSNGSKVAMAKPRLIERWPKTGAGDSVKLDLNANQRHLQLSSFVKQQTERIRK